MAGLERQTVTIRVETAVAVGIPPRSSDTLAWKAGAGAMEIQNQVQDGVHIISLRGRFDAPSAPDAERALRELLQQGMSRVVLDMSEVEYISSGGLRVVIMLTKALEKVGGELKLCGLTPFVSEVFKITNLSKRYEICANREQALAAFASVS